MLQNIKNAWKLFKIVSIHKYWVFYFCRKCGITWRGIVHDLSKYSPTEFLENLKYYHPDRSPVGVCKSKNGYSGAWQHHKGRNPHHYEYWTDNYDRGTTAIRMPKEYAIEMLCDWLAACKVYNGNIPIKEVYHKEWEHWTNRKNNVYMHPDTFKFIDNAIQILNAYAENKDWTSIDNFLKCIKNKWGWLNSMSEEKPNIKIKKGKN